MHDFDWDDVRVFLAIVEHGSLGKAAEHLGINQSTVGRRMNALEDKLDAALFERSRGNRWALTAAGEQMLASAELMNDNANAIAREVQRNRTDVRGQVTVTFADIGGRHLIMPVLATLASEFPELELRLHVSGDMLNLSNREADVAIRITEEVSGNVLATRICAVSMGVYGTPSLYERYRDGDRALPVVRWHDDKEVNAWLQSHFPGGKFGYRCNNSPAMTELVRHGVGVAALSCFEGDANDGMVRFREIPIIPGPSVWVISHTDLRTTARVRLVRDRLVDELMRVRHKIELQPTL
ncbi:MAG: LysR family transcriptional regulator [Pseudomonadota bacterium]